LRLGQNDGGDGAGFAIANLSSASAIVIGERGRSYVAVAALQLAPWKGHLVASAHFKKISGHRLAAPSVLRTTTTSSSSPPPRSVTRSPHHRTAAALWEFGIPGIYFILPLLIEAPVRATTLFLFPLLAGPFGLSRRWLAGQDRPDHPLGGRHSSTSFLCLSLLWRLWERPRQTKHHYKKTPTMVLVSN
jgi:hypothetical protein